LCYLHGAEHLARHHHFEGWFEYVQDIPGAFYLWIVEHLFVENRFVAGTLEIGAERVDLGRIGCPLFLLGDARDDITPPVQVFAAPTTSAPLAPTSRRTSTPAVTSASSWAPRRCASTGRRCWPPSSRVRVGTLHRRREGDATAERPRRF